MRGDQTIPRPVCPCGWSGAACAESDVDRNLRIHQSAKSCGLDRRMCVTCLLEPAHNASDLCRGCEDAQADTESPLDVGQPVLVGGIWRWQA